MPDDLLIRNSFHRFWMTWALILAVLTPPVWAFPPTVVAAPRPAPAVDGVSAPRAVRPALLPDWFAPDQPQPVLSLPPIALHTASTWSAPHWQAASPTLAKSASVVTATLSQVFTYTLVFTIPSPSTLTSVRMDDNLPNNVPSSEPDIRQNGVNGNYTGPTPVTPGTPPIAPGDVVPCGSGNYYLCWQLPNIVNTSGQPYIYRMTYQAYVYNSTSNNVRGEVGINAATLSWSGGSAADTVAVTIATPNVQVKRSVVTSGGESAASGASDFSLLDLRAGEILTVSVRVTNTAASFVSPAYNVRLRDNLPAWIDYESTLSGPAPTSQSGDTQLEWLATARGGNVDALDVLAVGEVLAVTYRARVVSGVSPGHSDDRNTEANFYHLPPASAARTLLAGNVRFASPNITLLKTFQEPPPTDQVVVGEVVTYTLAYTLPWGTTVYTPTYVQDELDDGLRFMGVVAQPAEVVALTVNESGQDDTVLQWYVNAPLTLTSDLQHTIVFTAQAEQYFFLGDNSGVAVPVSEQLNNRARLRWLNEAGSTDDSGWSTDVVVRMVRPEINPTKTGGLTGADTPVRFQLTVRNSTNTYADHAYNVVVSDTLPQGWTYVASQPAGFTTTLGGRTVITWGPTPVLTPAWYLPGPSASATVYVVTATSPSTLVVGALYTNTVEVGYDNAQGYHYLGRYDHEMSLALQAVKQAAPTGQMPVGTVITYSLVTTVPAHSILYWPRHLDTLPRGVRYIGWYDVSGGTLLTAPITGTSSSQETLTWWWNTLDNSASSSPLAAILRFRAAVSGVDVNDVAVWTGSADLRGAPNIRNRSVLAWNTEDVGGVYPASQNVDRADGAEEVIQPFLVDLAPVKALAAGGPTVESGDLLTYTFSVYNTGRAPAYDVIISDALPWGLVFHTYQARVLPVVGVPYAPTTSGAPTTGQGGVIGWVFDQLAAGDGNTSSPHTRMILTYTVQVTDSVGAGASLANSAWISDYTSLLGDQPYERHYDYLSGVGAPHSAGAVDVPPATIAKSASITEVALGGIVVFTLTAPAAPLGATLYNAVVTDAMPPPAPAGPLQVLTATATGAASLNVTSDTVAADFAAIPAHAQATVVITARVPVTAIGGVVQNSADLLWEDAPSGGATHTAAADPVAVTIIAPDVVLDKDAPAFVLSGAPIRYTLTYANDGAATAYDVTLTDTLPVSATYVGFSNDRPITQTDFAPLVWDLGSLAPGEGGAVWITVTTWLTTPLGSSLVNTATIHTSGAGDDPANNQASATTVVGGALLDIVKTAAPDPVHAGGEIVYTLVVTNSGSQTTQNLLITDRVPVSTTFVSASAGGSLAAGVVTWAPAQIGADQHTVVTFAVQVNSPLVSGTLIVNDAYGAEADNAPGATPEAVTVTVHSQPVLFIHKTAAGTVDAGAELVYTILYRNEGNAIAQGVRITESYDSNVTFVAAAPPPDVGDNVWLIGPLTPTADHTLVVTVRVPITVDNGALLTNLALINSAETGPVSDSVVTRVGDYLVYMPIVVKNYSPPPPEVNLVVQSIQVSPVAPTVGQATRISVTLHNSGTAAISGDFWVDLYVDPTTTPTVNVVWNDIAPYGKAWLVHTDIPAGGALVIHTDQPDDPDAPDDHYSNWPGWFVADGEHVLYVQVDSYGLPAGWIVESDETDNVNGPLAVSVGASANGFVLPPPTPWQERR